MARGPQEKPKGPPLQLKQEPHGENRCMSRRPISRILVTDFLVWGSQETPLNPMRAAEPVAERGHLVLVITRQMQISHFQECCCREGSGGIRVSLSHLRPNAGNRVPIKASFGRSSVLCGGVFGQTSPPDPVAFNADQFNVVFCGETRGKDEAFYSMSPRCKGSNVQLRSWFLGHLFSRPVVFKSYRPEAVRHT